MKVYGGAVLPNLNSQIRASSSGNAYKVTAIRIQAPTSTKTSGIQSVANFLTNRSIWHGLQWIYLINKILFSFFWAEYVRCIRGPGSSVGIATGYGLDGPGSNSGGDEIFRPSRPALGPTQPPVNGYRLFPGGKVRPGRAGDHSPPSSAAFMEE